MYFFMAEIDIYEQDIHASFFVLNFTISFP
jgi:hypothetical protein